MEIVIILVVVLLIFGPKNLPKLGKAFGSTVKNIREGMEGDDSSSAEEVEVIDEGDAEIRELERKLAEAKAKKEAEAESPIESHDK